MLRTPPRTLRTPRAAVISATVGPMRLGTRLCGVTLNLAVAMSPLPALAGESADDSSKDPSSEKVHDNSHGAKSQSESNEASSADSTETPGRKPGEQDRSFPHAGQFSLRVAFVGSERIISRYDTSPYCENPVPANPPDRKKFCGFGAPPAIDVALGYAPFNSLEAFAWGRFGLKGESDTNTQPLVAIGLGARLYTLNDSAFKFFIQPAVGWELEKGAGNLNWQGTEYKQDFLMQLLAGPQYDFSSGIGAFGAFGITTGIFRAIQTWMEFDIGVQARFP